MAEMLPESSQLRGTSERTVRPARPADLPALYDICVRTADAGADARGLYTSDDLMGDLFAAPYAVLEPDLTFVVDDGRGNAVGYVVGTSDTARFVARWREEWLPRFAARYPQPADPRDEAMVTLGYQPERMIVPELAAHPAHLHIDLLPAYQRQGLGRRLIDTFLAAAARAGAPAVHLGMLTSNVAARKFYDRLGFTELTVADAGPVTYLGRPTTGARDDEERP
jgi:ribosomal protein S18 acetylase RimI-like enzyme